MAPAIVGTLTETMAAPLVAESRIMGALMGLDTHSCVTMVVLCKFFLEALHTWTYTTNWQCYPPMGPRLYTPLSFSPG